MPVVNQQIVDNIVKQLKSQGIFDQFRRDCLADVDTKPSYQNLRQRVEGYVSKFLSQQTWNPSLNKNQLRDELRRQINESGMLSIGVEHVVDQIVNSKANRVFLPQIEIAARRYLGLDRDQNDEEYDQTVKDEKIADRTTVSDVKETPQNGVKDPVNFQLKEVPSQIIIHEKAQDTVIHIAEENKEEAINPPEPVSTKLQLKDYDSYVILNTSRETETTISGDDELLPPGVDFASPQKKLLVETEELIKAEDTSSSFNSEPLIIYDPQSSSNESSSELPYSNKGSPDGKTDPTIQQPNLDFKNDGTSSEASFSNLLKTKPSQVSTGLELKNEDETGSNVARTLDSKTSVDTDEKKSLESEIKKLLELGDKEKMEQEIRRILEIESKKMVEKELKKRESLEASKVLNEDGKPSSMENSRSNSFTDLTKEKPKTEKSRDSSLKSENFSRSNSSSDISREKQLSKSDKTKLSDVSSKSSSKHDGSKSKSHKSHDANKKSDSKSSKAFSKSSPSKGKPEQKSESKSSSDKSKSSTKLKSSSVKSSSKLPESKTIKSSEGFKTKPNSSSSAATKSDSSSRACKPELQITKEKSRFVPIKANIVKPVSKNSLATGKDKKHEKDCIKRDSATKLKTSEKKESHLFKSPDNRLSPEKKVEIESSETDDDFIKVLNNLKKGEDKKDDEDKKSDVSVSSVHTSDLSSFDDEISLSSDEEFKVVPVPTPVKEIKKLPLKDVKEITTSITKDRQTSGRSTPVPSEELEKKVDSYQSLDDSSSQREDITSETQTDDDDKGRRSGLRRQRKLNPKYASDEYSSIFNKTRRERKSTDDSKQSKTQTDPTESRKRRYSKAHERQSSKGDLESETLVKSSRTETAISKGGRDYLTVITLDDDSNSITELPADTFKPKGEFQNITKFKLGKNKK